MADPPQLPTADEFFGGPKPLPTADEFFRPPPPAPDSADYYRSAIDEDYVLGSNMGPILDAFGQGAKDGWGTRPLGLPEDTVKTLRQYGVFNDYETGRTSLVRSFNEALIRPAAAAIDATVRGISAIAGGIGGAIYGASEALTQAGVPPDLTPEAAAEAFPLGHLTGLPIRVPLEPSIGTRLLNRVVPPVVDKAADLGVIGKGDAGWRGLPAPPETPAAEAPAAGATHEAFGPPAPPVAEAAPVRDVHAAAREIAPEVFREYDPLSAQRDTLRGMLDDLTEQRAEGTSPEIAAIDREIEQLRTARLEALPAERAGLANQVTALETRRAGLVEELEKPGDTAAIARVRGDLQAVDYRMRDLAPQVSDAYRRAAEGEPPTVEPGVTAPEAPPAEAAPAPAVEPVPAAPAPPPPEAVPATPVTAAAAEPAVAPAEPRAAAPTAPLPGGIAGDVERKAIAAGYPADEARASGAVWQAYYETRAARFGGARGTAEDLYREDAPDIVASRAGRGVAPETLLADNELGQAASETKGHPEGEAEDAAWRRLQPERTAAGDYRGAPEDVTTPRQLRSLRQLIMQLIKEGTPGRFWYEDSAREVMRITRGNLADAERFIGLLAIYSPQTPVFTNNSFAIHAFEQWKRGEPIDVKTGIQDEKAFRWLEYGEDWGGRKTNNFYLNLMHDIVTEHPEAIKDLNIPPDVLTEIKGATVDLWVLRALGYRVDAAGGVSAGAGNKYGFAEREIQRAAGMLNKDLAEGERRWLPHQVQAALWSAIKARFELPAVKAATWADSIKAGFAKLEPDENGVLRQSAPAKNGPERQGHMLIWRKHALAASPEDVAREVENAKGSFGDAINRVAQNVTWEAIPTSALGHAINTASPDAKLAFTRQALGLLIDDDGNDTLAAHLGVNLNYNRLGIGAYAGDLNPNVVTTLVPEKPPGFFDATKARQYARALQYIFKQDAVPFFRADAKADFKNDFGVLNENGRVLKRFDTQEAAQALADRRIAEGKPSTVKGGKFARGLHLEFAQDVDEATQRRLLTALQEELGDDAGFTKTGDREITVINYRGDDGLPFVDDERFLDAVERVAARDDINASRVSKFGSEGEYGPIHDWQTEPLGPDPTIAGGSPALQRWVRDRAAAFERLLEDWRSDPERGPAETGERRGEPSAAGEPAAGPSARGPPAELEPAALRPDFLAAVKVTTRGGQERVYLGKRGELHFDVRVPDRVLSTALNVDPGFVDPATGKYYTRDEAYEATGYGEASQMQGAEEQLEKIREQNRTLEQTRRGKIRLASDQIPRAVITLFRSADASTLIHESGHAWLEDLMTDAAHPLAPDELRADATTVRKWLGVKEGEPIPTAAHEKFARGFERYMMEGHAPSAELAGVFARFRDWLIRIYQTVDRLRAPINDDIRGVFDRMLASRDEGSVVAPEREPAETFADLHEADAASMPPHQAGNAADMARAERDNVMSADHPEINDERLAAISPTEAGGGGAGGELPGAGGAAGGADTAAAGGVQERGAVGAGRGGAAPAGTRTPPPAEPNAPLGPADTRLIDKAGNIRLDNLNAPSDVEEAIRDAAERNADFTGERRGVVSDGQLLDLADALGKDPSFLDEKKIGQAFNAEEVLAARKLLVASATAVRDAMAAATTGGDAEIVALAKLIARHEMVQGKVAQATAEWGRAGRAFRSLEGWEGARDLNQLLKENTGRDLSQLREMAQLGSRLDTPAQVSKLIADSAGGRLRQAVIYYWVNTLISGPITHLTYSVGNAVNALWTPLVETPLAATSGAVRAALGVEDADRVFFNEATAQLYGLGKGFRDGVGAAVDAFKSGVSPPLPGERIPAEFLTPREAPIPGVVGTAIGLPGRSVSAIHSFFKTIRYEQNIAALAVREALGQGLEGAARDLRVAQLTQSPTEAMMESAVEDALKELYMRRQPYNSPGAYLARTTNSWLPAKILSPFVKIGSEIVRNAFVERTPLGVGSAEVRGNLAMREGGAEFDKQIGKIMAGTGLMAATVLGVLEGNITGDGPSDPNERRTWLLSHKPNSISVGPLSFSYARLGHLAMLTRFAANMTETGQRWDDEDGAKLAHSFFDAITRSVLDETWMRGVKDMFDAIYHPDEHFDSWVTQFVAQWTPYSIGLGQVARSIDPYQRETRDLSTASEILNQLKAHTPLWSQTLPPKRDMFGEPITTGSGTVDRYANDPVVKRMDELHIGLAPVERKIRGVPLTPQQYDDYARISGRMAKMELDAIVGSGPAFGMMPPETQIKSIKEIVSRARESAATLIMMQSYGGANDILKKAVDSKDAALHGATPLEVREKLKAR